MASLEDLLRQTQASYQFYLDNPEDEFNYDYTEPMMQPMMQPMEQTMMQPLTQDISIPNYIMPDMYEEDDEGTTYNLPLDIARRRTTSSNFDPTTLLTGLASLYTKTPIAALRYGYNAIDNYINPTPQSVFQFDNDVADARSETYSTNPGIGFSNIDPEDYDPNIGMDDEGLSATDVESFDREAASEQSDGGYDSEGADYSDSEMD